LRLGARGSVYGFLGKWRNYSRFVLIKVRRVLIVYIDPEGCFQSHEPREIGGSIMLTNGEDGRKTENWSLRITRRGPLLNVALLPAKRGKQAKPVCEKGHKIEGSYFPAGD
jgi:hypothetical protein